MSTSAKPGLGRKVLKIAGIVFGCVLGLLLVGTILLLTLLEPYAERYVKKQVVEASEGRYQLDFDAIHINLLSTTIRLRNLHLYPDSGRHQQQLAAGEASTLLLEVRSPELVIGQINLLDLLFKDRLHLRILRLEQPEITLLLDKRAAEQEDTGEPAEEGSGNPLPDFLKRMRVDDLHIPDATIRYLVRENRIVPKYIFPQLSFRLLGMELRELDQPDHTRMFDADDLQLSFSNFAYQTRDSVYHGHMGNFSYSSKKGELLVENFLLQGDEAANLARGSVEASPLLLALGSERLRITGMDLVEAYQRKELLITGIALENARVELLNNPAIPATTGEMPDLNEFYENLMEWVRVIAIEEFSLSKAAFKYHSRELGEMATIHALRQLDLSLHSIRLDSSTLFMPKDTFPVNDIHLKAQGYAYQHPRSPYFVDIGQLELSTADQFLQLDSLDVRGDWQKNDRLKQLPGDEAHFIVYNLKTPRIRISALDPIRAYQQSGLEVGSLEVSRPVFDILYDKQVEPPDIDSLYIHTYYALSDYIKFLQLGELRLQDASYTQHIKERRVSRLQKLEQATLVLQGIVLDSVYIFRGEPRLPLQEISLRARNYSMRTPDSTQRLQLGSLRYSSREQELSARKLVLAADPRANDRQKPAGEASPRLLDLSTPLFRVRGLDLIGDLNSGRLAIDEILLSEPQIALLQDRDVLPGTPDQDPQEASKVLFELFDPITVKTIWIEEGTVSYREKRDAVVRTQQLEQVSVSVSGLHLNPEALSSLEEALPLEDIRLTASDYSYRSPDSLYTIRLDSLHYSSRLQQLTARLFDVSYDPEVHAQRKAKNLAGASRNLFDIQARQFSISGFDLVRAYNSGVYHMEEMLLKNPQVSILQDQNVALRQDQLAAKEAGPAKTAAAADAAAEDDAAADATAADGEPDDDAAADEPAPAGDAPEQEGGETEQAEESNEAMEQTMEQLAEFVESFRVERLAIEEGAFEFSILEDTIQRSQKVDYVSLVLDNLRLVSLEATDPLEMFALDDLGLHIRDYSMLTADSLYAFRIGEIHNSLNSQTLTIDSITLEPLFLIEEYPDKLEYAADRVELKVAGIQVTGFDLGAFFNEQSLLAGRVLIGESEVDFYRDNRVDQDPDRYPPTLQKMLRDLPYTVRIDTVLMEKGKIVYSEISPKGVEPGVLTLADTRIEILNVTNDSLALQQNDVATVKGVSMLMAESLLKADFRFHLNHPRDLYTYEGSLEPMPFDAFNPLFEKLMHVRMESGKINKATFSVTADKDLAQGELRFRYNRLQLQLLNKEEDKNPGLLLNAGTWLINNVVIRSNNPSRLLNNFRLGEIEVERDYQKSAFNHMSSAMMSGMTSSLMPGFIERLLNTFIDLP
jgi:hypothetical protein